MELTKDKLTCYSPQDICWIDFLYKIEIYEQIVEEREIEKS